MTLFHTGLMEVVQRDPRYAYEAYEFLFHALHHTQKMLGREPPEVAEGEPPPPVDKRYHVSGKELAHGARELALREFGFMARTVFRQSFQRRLASTGPGKRNVRSESLQKN